MKWVKKIMGCVSEYIDQRGKSMATNWGAAQQAMDLQQLKMQQQALMNGAAAQIQMQNNLAGNVFGGYAAQQAQTPQRTTLGEYHLTNKASWTFEELNDEGSVYNMPLQTAVDLAINKFGSGWFKDETTADALEENKDFWLKVMHKLFNNQRLLLENCYKPDTFENVVAWKILDTDHGNR